MRWSEVIRGSLPWAQRSSDGWWHCSDLDLGLSKGEDQPHVQVQNSPDETVGEAPWEQLQTHHHPERDVGVMGCKDRDSWDYAGLIRGRTEVRKRKIKVAWGGSRWGRNERRSQLQGWWSVRFPGHALCVFTTACPIFLLNSISKSFPGRGSVCSVWMDI